MNPAVVGLATASPKYSINQQDSVEIATTFCGDPELGRKLTALYRMSRVQSRGSVLLERPEGSQPRQTFFPVSTGPSGKGPRVSERMRLYAEEARPLAVEASRKALADAGVDPQDAAYLITVTCTGFQAPGFDVALMKQLPLSPDAQRTQIGFMGCHGAINGLRAARAYATASPGSTVLLCAVELCSLHFHYGVDPEQMVANALFADGAAAAVIRASESEQSSGWNLVDVGSRLFPDCEDAMTWTIGDHGFVMTLSPQVPDLIASHLRPWLGDWLAKHDLRVEDVRSWAVHPGGPRILLAAAEALELDDQAMAASREVFANHGNMSSPTLLFILKRLRDQSAPTPCVALGFGPGLVAEAALFR
ncbi:MAG: type III polyketide synthase [Planctomycetales bacterium]